MVDHFAPHLLGRHVIQRSHRGASRGECWISAGTGDAEVHELHHALWRQHHIGGLDVAMDHILPMRIAKGIECLTDVL